MLRFGIRSVSVFLFSVVLSQPASAGRLLEEFRRETRERMHPPRRSLLEQERERRRQENWEFIHGPPRKSLLEQERERRREEWRHPRREVPRRLSLAERRQQEREAEKAAEKERERKEWLNRPFPRPTPPQEERYFNSVVPFFSNLEGARAELQIDNLEHKFLMKVPVQIYGAELAAQYLGMSKEAFQRAAVDALNFAGHYLNFDRGAFHFLYTFNDMTTEGVLVPDGKGGFRKPTYAEQRTRIEEYITDIRERQQALPLLFIPYKKTDRQRPKVLDRRENNPHLWAIDSDPVFLAQQIMRLMSFSGSPERDRSYPSSSLMADRLDSTLYERLTGKDPKLTLKEWHNAMYVLALRWADFMKVDPEIIDQGTRPRYEARVDLPDPSRLSWNDRLLNARRRLALLPEFNGRMPRKDRCERALKRGY